MTVLSLTPRENEVLYKYFYGFKLNYKEQRILNKIKKKSKKAFKFFDY